MKLSKNSFFNKFLLHSIIFALFAVCYTRPANANLDKNASTCKSSKCHDDYDKKEYVHVPVADGLCKDCHFAVMEEHPNTNTLDFIFAAEGKDLCFSCHEEKKRHLTTAKVKHSLLEDGTCLICHDPHSSEFKRLLKAPVSIICATCHEHFGDKIMKDANIHMPVKQGDCYACHDPHGSDYEMILKKNFAIKYNVDFDIESYALCFDCHNKEIVTEPDAKTITKFRNGNVNLHYKHVNMKSKGKNCVTCHEIHSSRQKSRVRVVKSLKRKQISRFEQDDDGGTCTTGCHKQKNYSRAK